MNFFKFAKLGRTLFLLTAVLALGIIGCGGDDDDSEPDNGAVDPKTVVKGTFIDGRDGTEYKTVTIGKQTWMAENLNYWTNSGSWCYENRQDNCEKYGKLYNWDAANKTCPKGWHLPSSDEWQILNRAITYVGDYSSSVALKSKSGWNDWCGYSGNDSCTNGNGTNDYGFSALPGGHWENGFYQTGEIGYWWLTTGFITMWYNSNFVYLDDNNTISLDNDGNRILFDISEYSSYGFSVRCLKDA